MNNLVSIITPMYNAEKYIKDTIESVISQEYKEWEMIVVDDCSTDGCTEIVKKYSNKDSRIKYIRSEKNGGVSKARNLALKNASGRYIAFLDSDDIWSPEKLSRQIDFMKKENATISFTSYELINEDNERIGKIISVPEKVDYKTLLKGNIMGCLTVIIDRENLDQEIKMSGYRHEDYVLWLSILKQGYYAYGLNDVLAFYRKTPESLSGNKMKSAMWTWNIYRNVEKISLIKSIYYFINYAVNGIKKSKVKGGVK
ncbi:glycosyltransferase family 2 protein [Peptacetobacter hominis]|uniref:Glycosyltransferase family 2 protein n=1 Tax=Peptacetobacter hominis TaxID=2743610 RepID=A0A544QTB8_9FIRM|nr:glycosyltransferase family 2 protein [Peptacetobacter hominis]TQQ83941.1 glycosyltransferase family 2 protein [Peptacetobacter hominis]